MNVLDRYVATAVLRGVTLVMVVLISVGTVFEFMGQLPDVGTAQYSIGDAVAFVVMRIPRLVVRLLPAAALIGALLGLGNLAVQRELVVMRASGISLARLMGSVAAAGVVLMVVMALLGESLAPSMSVYARDMRARALLDTEDVASGGASTWLKSGDRIVNLRREASGFGFGGVYLFELDDEQGLTHIAHADSTDIDPANRWILENYAETVFDGLTGVTASASRQAVKDYGLSLELLEFSVIQAGSARYQRADPLHRLPAGERPGRNRLPDRLLGAHGGHRLGSAHDAVGPAVRARRHGLGGHRCPDACRAVDRVGLLRDSAGICQQRPGFRSGSRGGCLAAHGGIAAGQRAGLFKGAVVLYPTDTQLSVG